MIKELDPGRTMLLASFPPYSHLKVDLVLVKTFVFAPNDYISSLLKTKNNFRNGPEYIFSGTFLLRL